MTGGRSSVLRKPVSTASVALCTALARVMAAMLMLIAAAATQAHPVAQGAMQIDVRDTSVNVHVRASLEEAIIENAFGPVATRANSTAELQRSHARYVAGHVRVEVDGQPLSGRVVDNPPSAASATAPSDRVSFDLRYDFPTRLQGAGARALRVSQNVLNEFEFAPGNRWEATYVVSFAEQGRTKVEGLLLTSREPLSYRTHGGDGRRSDAAAAPQVDRWRLSTDYLRHGVLHILTGYDHLLFISALVVATVTLWDLIKIITAFTLAHTLTLTLAVLDIVRVSSQIVEPMIALSIVVVALDNVLRPQHSRGNGRLLIAFLFGLFHGLGFAGGLLSAMEGMAASMVGIAIIAFSVGVELGHQIVVLPVFGALRLAETLRPNSRAIAMKYGSMLIAAAGGVYLVAALQW